MLASLSSRPAEVPGLYPTSSAAWKLLTGSHWATFGHIPIPEPVTLVKELLWASWPGEGHGITMVLPRRKGHLYLKYLEWEKVRNSCPKGIQKVVSEEGALDTGRQKQMFSGLAVEQNCPGALCLTSKDHVTSLTTHSKDTGSSWVDWLFVLEDPRPTYTLRISLIHSENERPCGLMQNNG